MLQTASRSQSKHGLAQQVNDSTNCKLLLPFINYVQTTANSDPASTICTSIVALLFAVAAGIMSLEAHRIGHRAGSFGCFHFVQSGRPKLAHSS